jgi:plasmid stabilization system protein ParE
VKRIVPRVEAERDIDEVTDYYTDEAGDDVAHGFIEALQEAYRAISEHPGTAQCGQLFRAKATAAILPSGLRGRHSGGLAGFTTSLSVPGRRY